MSESRNEGKPFDPLQAWRGIRDANMDVWAKAMVEAVNSEEYAKASGMMLDAYLTASIPFAEMLKKAMTQALQQANMPTRDDFVSLAERLTQVEMRLDDLDARLDEFATRQTDRPAKKRTRKAK